MTKHIKQKLQYCDRNTKITQSTMYDDKKKSLKKISKNIYAFLW